MGKKISIKVEFSADSVRDELTEAQIDDYADTLANQIQDKYPDAEIDVRQSINNRVGVVVDRDHVRDVDEIVADARREECISEDVNYIIEDHSQDWTAIEDMTE